MHSAQRRVGRAVQLLNAEEPQIHSVLATGDLTSDGHTPEESWARVSAHCPAANLGRPSSHEQGPRRVADT